MSCFVDKVDHQTDKLLQKEVIKFCLKNTSVLLNVILQFCFVNTAKIRVRTRTVLHFFAS